MRSMRLRGDRVRALLSERSLTLGEFHVQVRQYRPSVAWRTLSEVVNEKRCPSLPVVQAMAEALGVVPDYLLDLTDDPQGSTELGVIAERDIAPVVDRLNALPPDKRKKMVTIIDGILTLAGQPAARIVGRPPEEIPVQLVMPTGKPWEELSEEERLERTILQIADKKDQEGKERMLADIAEMLGANSAARRASSSSTVRAERKPVKPKR